MTYTVIGRCPRTNQIGVGIATYSLASGSFTQGAQTAHGISISQANVRKGNAVLANNLLAQGYSCHSVLRALVEDDPHQDYRQIAVMTRSGAAAVHTGARVAGWCGSICRQDFVAFGNVLDGEQVIHAMAQGFADDPQAPLPERLIRALELGRNAGGQASGGTRMSERSAAIVVMGDSPCAMWDLRVDLHDTAVEELRRLYEVFKPYQPYYQARDDDPSQTPAQLAWEQARSGGRLGMTAAPAST
ncbi:MAG: DUF1028 domain-containing protein [Ramlibacter sp.]|nr:DUF1028 domain-containing protein [Ramlibacter sp.]